MRDFLYLQLITQILNLVDVYMSIYLLFIIYLYNFHIKFVVDKNVLFWNSQQMLDPEM